MKEQSEITGLKEKVTFRQRHEYGFLGTISFTESAFLPILTDPFLLAMTLAKPHMWLRYTLVAAATSVLGGLFGYFLGAVFFELVGSKIISFYNLENLFAETVASVDRGAFLFTLLGAFTPIPYKLTAIVGGMLHINLGVFIVASIIGRLARFMLVGYVCYRFGKHTLPHFKTRTKIGLVALTGGVLLYILLLAVGY
jgi:membrane protein YqaA with SNARE-associated domain